MKIKKHKNKIFLLGALVALFFAGQVMTPVEVGAKSVCKVYREYKKEFRSKGNREDYLKIKKLKKRERDEYNVYKDFYETHKKYTKEQIKQLSPEFQDVFNEYRSYKGYKNYLSYKIK